MMDAGAEITKVERQPPDRLTIFTFLWACQSLVHHEFYQTWLPAGNPLGWVLAAASVAAMLYPHRTIALTSLCAASVAYNVDKWPFVVNHILLESLANIVVLLALAVTRIRSIRSARERRVAAYDRFSPILMWAMVVMYFFAFLAKLNHDFFDPDISCVSVMYERLVDRFSFLPRTPTARSLVIWATLVVELAIPVFLSARRTRWLAIAIGLPFHLILGLVGHRTFSALAYVFYALFIMDPLHALVGRGFSKAIERGERALRRYVVGFRCAAAGTVAILISARLAGQYEAGIGPLKFFRAAWVIWILWSLLVCAVYAAAFWRSRSVPDVRRQPARPGWLWAFIGLVVLNGSSQYLGLKTQTCFTMYSNLRTEGGINNHFFMPAFRLTGYQDDLVEVLEITHAPVNAQYPELRNVLRTIQESSERSQYVVRFELQRAAQMSRNAMVSLRIRYQDGDVVREYDSRDEENGEMMQDHPTWIGKLLFFRPVDKDGHMRCRH